MTTVRALVAPLLAVALLGVLGACSGGGAPDAGPGVDLADAAVPADVAGDRPADDRLPPGDTGAPPDGSPGDGPVPDGTGAPALTVAAWNLRGYPASAAAPDAVAGEIAGLGVDLLAVSEVVDAGAFAALATSLGGYEQALVPAQAPGDDNQLGLLWRAATVTLSAIEPLFTDDPEVFPRPAVLAEVTPAAAPARAFTIVALHLKAGTDEADEQLRAQAVARLEGFVRGRGEAADVRLLVLGDMNVAPSDAMAAQVMAPFLDAPERYRVLTWALAKAGAVTFVPAGIMLDHAVATAGLFASVAEPVIPPLDERIAGYETEVSDHLPIVLTLSLE